MPAIVDILVVVAAAAIAAAEIGAKHDDAWESVVHEMALHSLPPHLAQQYPNADAARLLSAESRYDGESGV